MELLLYILWYLIGLVFLINQKSLRIGQIIPLCFGTGLGISCLFYLGFLLLGFKLNVSFVIGLNLALALVSLMLCFKSSAVSFRAVLGFILFSIFSTSIYLLNEKFSYTVLSYDSYKMIIQARSIGIEGRIIPEVGEALGSWGVLLILVNALGVAFGSEFLSSFQPILFSNFIIFFASTLLSFFSNLGLFKKIRSLLTLLGCLTLVTTYFIFFQMFYLHNALISAFYLFGFLCMVWRPDFRWDLNFANVALYIFFIMFCISRIEAPIMGLLALAFASWHWQIKQIEPSKLIYFALSVVTLWQLKLVSMIGVGDEISSPTRIYLLIALLCSAYPILYFRKNFIVEWCLERVPYLVLGLLLVTLGICFLLKFDHMNESIYSTYSNLHETGRWGFTWNAIVLSLILLILFGRVKQTDFIFLGQPISIILTIQVLAFLRTPYRLAWGDSANRMMVHVLVPLIFFILINVGRGLVVLQNNKSKVIRSQ